MNVTYALILLTWVVYLGGLIGIGLLLVRLVFPATRGRDAVQAAIWWGLAVFALGAAAVGLVTALSSPAGMVTLALLLGVGWIALAILGGRRVPAALRAVRTSWTWRRVPTLLTAALLVLAELMIVRFAAASPMDGDSGLYRVGVITYASKYGPVPGLANLHDRFGFNTSTSTMAALMDQGIWAGNGFRLIVGLLLTALITSVLLRLLLPRDGGATAADWFAVIGTAFVLALVLTDSGRWVPSPASDLLAVIFGIAATCYLLDVLQKRDVPLSASTALAAAATAGSIRPLGWVTAAAVGLVLLVHVGRDSKGASRTRVLVRSLLPGAIIAAALLITMLARDALLTGWLFYPSTIFGLDVPWRTVPGTNTAEWITSWGRAPNVDKAVVLADNSWLGPWLERLWQSRELRLNLYMGVALIIPLFYGAGRYAWRRSWSVVAWALVPTLVTAIIWFVTAPDVRFGWLAFVGIAGVPLAVLLAYEAFPATLVRVAGIIVLLAMALSNVSNGRVGPRGADPQPVSANWGPISTRLMLGPHPPMDLTPVTLSDGTPGWLASDHQCWATVPACINTDPSKIYRLGPAVQDGYASLDRDRP